MTLTVKPDEGYVLTGIEVKDAYENVLKVEGGLWYSNNTATFIMPITDVTVTPTFTNKLDTFHLDMPNFGGMTAFIPSGVSSIKLYDDGGKDGFYTQFSTTTTLQLFAPKDNLLKVQGSMQTWD